MKGRPNSSINAIIAAIEKAGVPIVHGTRQTLSIRDGDLEIDIAVSVTRRLTVAERAGHHDAALADLREKPRSKCHHSKQNRGPWRITKTSTCYAPITSIIVTKSLIGEHVSYDPVCTVHAQHHGYEPRVVVEIVNLTRRERDEIKRLAEAAHAAWIASTDSKL